MDTPASFTAVIDHVGGYATAAKMMGCPLGTASSMRTRNFIPSKYWGPLISGANKAGFKTITLELLHRLESEVRAAKTAAPPEQPMAASA